ncbi:SERPIN/Spi3 ortholog [Tanapox virus]|uniref:SERPIN/Spi3 ortholog n=1 Tax=Tanapox virus TaxID=99000 RepID=A7XCW0_9POXV|nr:SERPIN/Spi3 ortholog [Tanapox virus]
MMYLNNVILLAIINTIFAKTIPKSSTSFELKIFKNSLKLGENYGFSPYGVLSVMCMIQSATAGKSKQQIINITGIDANVFGKIVNVISNSTTVVSEIFVQRNIKIQKEFMLNFYGLFNKTVKHVYFNDTNSTYIINDYVSKITNGKINDIISSDVLSYNTKMVAINAIYFNGDWKHTFPLEGTKDGVFYKDDKTTLTVKMMTQIGKFNYGEFVIPNTNKYCKVIELPYVDDNISMLVIVPNDNNFSIYKLLSKINEIDLGILKTNIKETLIQVSMPKFFIKSKNHLKKSLRKLGITYIFNKNNANFRAMTTENIYVYKAFQDVQIIVDEQGTTAQSSTAIVAIARRSIDTITFNRPFLFFITYKPYNTILFSGIVVEPKIVES